MSKASSITLTCYRFGGVAPTKALLLSGSTVSNRMRMFRRLSLNKMVNGIYRLNLLKLKKNNGWQSKIRVLPI